MAMESLKKHFKKQNIKKRIIFLLPLFLISFYLLALSPPNSVVSAKETGYFNFIDAGEAYSVAINEKGELWGWGRNTEGQFGTMDSGNSQKKKILLMKDVVSVSAGKSHILALKSNGEVWALGKNEYGQLGNGTLEDAPEPIKIMEKIIQISAGAYHSMALDRKGMVWIWGSNQKGQLGTNQYPIRKTPHKFMSDITFIEAGASTSYVIKKNGDLLVWGNNNGAQFGNGKFKQHSYKSYKIMGNVKMVSAGTETALALLKNGDVWAWGNGLGDPKTGFCLVKPIKMMSNAISIKAGCDSELMSEAVFAINNKNELYTWGDTQMIYGKEYKTPKKIASNVLDAAYGEHLLILKTNGNLYGEGTNYYNEILVNNSKNILHNQLIQKKTRKQASVKTYQDSPKEIKLAAEKKVKPASFSIGKEQNIFTTGAASFALVDNVLYGWGSEDTLNFICKENIKENVVKPKVIMSKVKYFNITNREFDDNIAGTIITQDGSLYTWGNKNKNGQLGNGTTKATTSPQKILSGVTDAKIMGNHGFALKSNGELYGWGDPKTSGLGIEAKSIVLKPKKFLDNVKTFSVQGNYGMAIKKDGSLWSWGWNYNGRLGDGTQKDRTTPKKIATGVKKVITKNNGITFFIKKDNSLWGFGSQYNDEANLGNGLNKNSLVPKKIMTKVLDVFYFGTFSETYVIKSDHSLWYWGKSLIPIKLMEAVAAVSYQHAIKLDGSLWGWNFDYGYTGDGTKKVQMEPVFITDHVKYVQGAYGNTMFEKTDGSMWIFGNDTSGEIGNPEKGYGYDQLKPYNIFETSLEEFSEESF